LSKEQAVLMPLPELDMAAGPTANNGRIVPVQSLQHPLSVYNALLEIQA
jgi:hypothetical protein